MTDSTSTSTDADIEREISSVELADFVRDEWLYGDTGDETDQAVHDLLVRLCKRFEIKEPFND